MRRRVVITGTGCVTPLGTSVEELWSRLLRCESGVGYTTVFDAQQFPHANLRRSPRLEHQRHRRRPAALETSWPALLFCRGAANQAVHAAGIDGSVEPDTVWRVSRLRRRPARL